MTENAVEDEHGSEAYDPDLYIPTGEAEPVNGLEHVSDAEIERFKAQGFLAVEGAFSDAQMADAIKAVENLIDGKNQGFRGVQFERGVRDQLTGASEGKRQTLVRKLQQWVGFDARLDSLARDRAPAGRARVHDGRTSQALPPPGHAETGPHRPARNPGTKTTRTSICPWTQRSSACGSPCKRRIATTAACT